MKNKIIIVLTLVIIGIPVSCVSLQDREMTANDRAEANIIGSVEAQFTSFQFFHIPAKNSLKSKARSELMREARKQYQGNIDIRNIDITGGFSGWEIAWAVAPGLIGTVTDFILWEYPILAPAGFGLNVIGNFQKITATGDVVMLGNAGGTAGRTGTNARRPSNQSAVEAAMNDAAEVIMGSLQRNQKLAIVNVSSADRDISEFVAYELEFLLVNNRFTVVDRSELDRIRREQDFQLSGDVDDNTIVSIGRFAGADVVLTGAITGTGDMRRLRLRALNTQTAQVMAVSSERF